VATIDQTLVKLLVVGPFVEIDLRLVNGGLAGFRGNLVGVGAVPAFPALVDA
jgi:hypothetical protein